MQEAQGPRAVGCPRLMSAALAGPSPGQVHGERVEVDVLNIDVSVLDDAGRPITGLDEARFRVRLDGQPQEIDYFAEIRNGARAADPPGPETAGELPIRLLVFVDETTLRQDDRDDALAGLDRQLSTLAQPSEVAIYAFDGRQLHELQPWTGSRQEVHLAMAKAATRESPFSRLDLQRRTRRKAVGCRGKQEIVIDEARRRSEAAVAAFDIAGEPSVRGAMVVVAGSWPASVPRCGEHEGSRAQRPSADRASPLDPPEPADAEARLWSAYRLLSDEVARRQWVLFPWDGSGFVPNLQSIDVETAPRAGEGTGTPGRVAGDEQRLHGLLDRLARETGGQALLNAEVDRFATVLTASMTSYYSLGLTWGRDRRRSEASLEIDALVEGARTLHRKQAISFSTRRKFGFEERRGGWPLRCGSRWAEPSSGEWWRWWTEVSRGPPVASPSSFSSSGPEPDRGVPSA